MLGPVFSPQRIDNSKQFSVPYVYCISTTVRLTPCRCARKGVGVEVAGQERAEKKDASGPRQICYSVRLRRPDIWMLRRFHGVERRTGWTVNGKRKSYQRELSSLFCLSFVILWVFVKLRCIRSRALLTTHAAGECLFLFTHLYALYLNHVWHFSYTNLYPSRKTFVRGEVVI